MVEKFYEDVEKAVKKQKTHFSIVIYDVNATVGTKSDYEVAVVRFGILYSILE